MPSPNWYEKNIYDNIDIGDESIPTLFGRGVHLNLTDCLLTSFLLKGHFQFKKECKAKYGEDIYNLFMDAFDHLPVGATLENGDGKYLCVHGGLSPALPTIEDMQRFDRKQEIPKKGPLCDLVWSDPLEEGLAAFSSRFLLCRTHHNVDVCLTSPICRVWGGVVAGGHERMV